MFGLTIDREEELHGWLTYAVYVLAVLTIIGTCVITAPYGRHFRGGWGPSVNVRLGWILMECPSALWFFYVYWKGSHKSDTTPVIAATLWLTHYCYRSFVYPFLIRSGKDKRWPVSLVLTADVYNAINSYINARYLSEFGHYSTDHPFSRPSFYIGLVMFLVGITINIQSDHILINLRKPGETGYVIPHGGMFEYISAPNYFGELLEWTGWSILVWSPAAFSFAVYTASNLVPRAFSNHRWYQDKFKDAYPRSRRAFIPFLI